MATHDEFLEAYNKRQSALRSVPVAKKKTLADTRPTREAYTKVAKTTEDIKQERLEALANQIKTRANEIKAEREARERQDAVISKGGVDAQVALAQRQLDEARGMNKGVRASSASSALMNAMKQKYATDNAKLELSKAKENRNMNNLPDALTHAVNSLEYKQALAKYGNRDNVLWKGVAVSPRELAALDVIKSQNKELANTYENYLVNKGRQEIAHGINDQKGTDNGVFDAILGVGAGLEGYLGGLKQNLTHDVRNKSIAELAAEERGQELEGGRKAALDIGQAVGNMALPVMTSTVAGAVGAPAAMANIAGAGLLGASARGNAYAQEVENGATATEANTYSLINGTLEGAMQYLLGGISGLGGVAVKSIGGKIANKLPDAVAGRVSDVALKVARNPSAQKAIQSLATAGSQVGKSGAEFTEEYLQAIIDPVVRNVVLDENNEVKAFSDDALYAGIIGALTAVGMNAGSIRSDYQRAGETIDPLINNAILGRVNEMNENADDISRLARSVRNKGDYAARKVAEDEELSAQVRAMGREAAAIEKGAEAQQRSLSDELLALYDERNFPNEQKAKSASEMLEEAYNNASKETVRRRETLDGEVTTPYEIQKQEEARRQDEETLKQEESARQAAQREADAAEVMAIAPEITELSAKVLSGKGTDEDIARLNELTEQAKEMTKRHEHDNEVTLNWENIPSEKELYEILGPPTDENTQDTDISEDEPVSNAEELEEAPATTFIGETPDTESVTPVSAPTIDNEIAKMGEGKGKRVETKTVTNTLEKAKRSGLLAEEVAAMMNMDTTHKQYTNEQAIQEANEAIDKYGEDEVADNIRQSMAFNGALNTKQATAALILADRFYKEGNKEKSSEMWAAYKEGGLSSSGRTLEIGNMITATCPDAVIDTYNKVLKKHGVEKLNKDEEKTVLAITKLANKMEDFVNGTPEGRQEILTKYTTDIDPKVSKKINKFLNNLMKKDKKIEGKLKNREAEELANTISLVIDQYVGEKVASTFEDKFRAYQRINMLLNTKTIIRNIAGNIAESAVDITANVFSPIIDIAISKTTGTRTAASPSAKEMAKGAYKGIREVRDATVNDTLSQISNKFTEGGTAAQTFKNRGLRLLDKAVSLSLSAGDRPFYQARYNDVMNQFKKLEEKGKNVPCIEDQRVIADQAARETTFQDDSAVANTITELRRVIAGNKGNKVRHVLAYSVFPFTKTPGNIMQRMIEMTPAGGAAALFNYGSKKRAMKKGKYTITPQEQRVIVDKLSRSLLGTAIGTIGFFLTQWTGMLSGEDEEDEAYREANGITDNSIKIGGVWFDFSSLGPLPTILNLGASIYNTVHEVTDDKKKAITMTEAILDSIASPLNDIAGDTLWENLIDAIDYIGDKDMQGMTWNWAGDFARQMVPMGSFLRQVAYVIDPNKRETSADGEGGWMTKGILASIPYVSKMLPEKKDVITGESIRRNPEANTEVGRIIDTFLNPANTSKDRTDDPVMQELNKLYESTGKASVFIEKAPYKETYEEEKVSISGKNRSDYQETYSKTAYDTLKDMLKSSEYKSATTDDKLEMVSSAKSYADAAAKHQFTMNTGKQLMSVDSSKYEAYNALHSIKGHKGSPGKALAAVGDSPFALKGYDKASSKEMVDQYVDAYKFKASIEGTGKGQKDKVRDRLIKDYGYKHGSQPFLDMLTWLYPDGPAKSDY